MNIHIVCQRINKDRVLPRLARTLAASTGWSIAEYPVPDASINYFFPYIELQKKTWHSTPVAAWFTHRDTNDNRKAALWDVIAGQVDLRTLTAGVYKEQLEQFGTVEMVRPAVDEVFVPIKQRNRKRRVIGLSGYSYHDNRKGEDLIAQLVKTPEAQDCDWRASGRDWPVPTKTYTWADMPGFYQSLDLYICASRIEGVPMPPLEVLACGVPVIIPRRVGMLDDLPDIEGIYRFEPGNYDSLRKAFDKATRAKPPKPDSLRAAVEQYSAVNWADDHIAAFEKFLYQTGPVAEEVLPDWRGNSGMYCVAFGEPSRNCARRLIPSFKKYMPDVPVALIASSKLDCGEDIFIEHPDRDIGGRLAKLAIDELAPKEWKYVLYLDADTELNEPIDFIYQLLADGWEFVICKDQDERHYLAKMRRGDNNDECDYTETITGTDQVMQYNGGVFAFRRNDATKKFFELWNSEYQHWLGRDQGALIRALYQNRLRTFVLMNQFNASDRYPFPPEPIAIVHHNMQARRWDKGPDVHRLTSRDAFAAVKRWEDKHNVQERSKLRRG